jgi:hypothetical protein
MDGKIGRISNEDGEGTSKKVENPDISRDRLAEARKVYMRFRQSPDASSSSSTALDASGRGGEHHEGLVTSPSEEQGLARLAQEISSLSLTDSLNIIENINIIEDVESKIRSVMELNRINNEEQLPWPSRHLLLHRNHLDLYKKIEELTDSEHEKLKEILDKEQAKLSKRLEDDIKHLEQIHGIISSFSSFAEKYPSLKKKIKEATDTLKNLASSAITLVKDGDILAPIHNLVMMGEYSSVEDLDMLSQRFLGVPLHEGASLVGNQLQEWYDKEDNYTDNLLHLTEDLLHLDESLCQLVKEHPDIHQLMGDNFTAACQSLDLSELRNSRQALSEAFGNVLEELQRKENELDSKIEDYRSNFAKDANKLIDKINNLSKKRVQLDLFSKRLSK